MTICDCNQGRLPCSCKNPLTGDGDDTIQFQLDAAQSELAALREELEHQKAVTKIAIDDAALLQKGLTATEQRNALMSQFLKRMLDGHGMDRLAAWQSEIDMVLADACDKPTESGASE